MTLANSGQLGLRGHLTATGWTPPDDMTYAEWEASIRTLRAVGEAVQFWLGDALRYGQQRYGETYTQVLEETDYQYSSLATMVYVAERVESSSRDELLSWSHHKVVAPYDAPRQHELLERARSEGLTVAALRAIATAKEPKPKSEAIPGAIICPQCAYRFPRERSTILAMFDPDELGDFAGRYPGVDLDYEAQRFTDWWAEDRRRLKKPRSGFRNWLEKSWQIRDRPREDDTWV